MISNTVRPHRPASPSDPYLDALRRHVEALDAEPSGGDERVRAHQRWSQATDAILSAGVRLARRGLIVATEGNLSVRLGDRILVTPTGRRKDELSADDLALVPLDPAAPSHDPDRPDLRPTSDLRIHRAAYAARPDIMAVAHAHLPASLAVTVAGEIPDPAILPETRLFIPRLPFLPAMDPGGEELAAAVGATLADGIEPTANVVLLERHGAVAVGVNLDQAVDRLELVDLLCRVWRDARLLELAKRLAAPTS